MPYAKGKYAYGEIESGKVLFYDEKLHLRKLEVNNVSKFGEDDLSLDSDSKGSEDFKLD